MPVWKFASGVVKALEDVSLDLAAVLGELIDAPLRLSATDGTVLEDVTLNLQLWKDDLQDAQTSLGAYYLDVEDAKTRLLWWKDALFDVRMQVDAIGLVRENLPLPLKALGPGLTDVTMQLFADSGLILKDAGLTLETTRGDAFKNIRLRLLCTRGLPQSRLSIVQRSKAVVSRRV